MGVFFSICVGLSSFLFGFDDPQYKNQKALDQIGFKSSVHQIEQLVQGTSFAVEVGVIDSGPLNPDHPELLGQVAPGSDTQRSSHKPEHGQKVAGILASRANNSYGGVGILGPWVRLHYRNVTRPLKKEDTRYTNYSQVAQEIVRLAHQDVDVISISLGAPNGQPIYAIRPIYEAIAKALELGSPVVVSAANKGVQIQMTPLHPKGLIVVAAGTPSQVFSHSNYGQGVSLTAPDTMKPLLTATGLGPSEHGTSFATPLVAGAVGLLRALGRLNGKKLTPVTIKKHLIKNSKGDTYFLDLKQALQNPPWN